MPERKGWKAEVTDFVRDRRFLGYFTTHPLTWKLGRCVRCGTAEGVMLGFDAYIPVCPGCSETVKRVESEADR